MSYYHAKTLPLTFGEALERVEAILAQEGFGVISRIDIQNALKTKINVDFRPYTILGACNPALAYEALKLEDKVGTMLRAMSSSRILEVERRSRRSTRWLQ